MKLNITKANRWRFPKVRYTNFRKEYPNMGNGCFQDWIFFNRYWGGKIWSFGVKHHEVNLDFRMCALSDLIWPNTTKQDRKAVKEANKFIK